MVQHSKVLLLHNYNIANSTKEIAHFSK